MNTVSELNKKLWYRLVKVIFIVFVLFCTISSFLLIYDDYKPRQVKDYRIDCVAEYSNKKSMFAEKDAGIYIYQYGKNDIYESLAADTYASERKKIKEFCDISDEEVEIHRQPMLKYIEEQDKLGTKREDIQKYIYDNFLPYKITETYVTKGGYLLVVAYSLLSVLIASVIVEIVRRIFYYIVLGKIKPKKDPTIE